MQAKKKQLIIFAVVFVVLLAAVVVLLLLPNGEDETAETSSTTSSSDSITLWTYEDSDVVSISVENPYGDFTMVPDGEDSFIIEELSAYDAYTTKYTYFTSSVLELAAESVVEESAEDLDKYGLSDPQATVVITLEDGTVSTFMLGDVSVDDVSYYGKVEGDDTVYLIDMYTSGYVLQSQYEYISRSLTEGSETVTNDDGEEETVSPTLSYLQITRADLDYPITIVPSDDADETEGLTVSGYTITSPVVIDVGYDQSSTYLDTTIGMAADSIVGTANTDAELAAYGLDNPSMTLVIQLDDTRTRMKFGSAIESDGEVTGYYMMTATTDLVYIMAADDVPWMTVQVSELMSTTLLNPVITTVSSLTVNVNGTDYVFTLSGEEDGSASDLDIRYNGQQIVTEQFQNYYMVLISLEAVDILPEDVSSDPEVTITYHYIDEEKEDDVVSLIPMTDRRYAVRVNGRDDFIVYATSVQKIESDLQTLIAGGEINPTY